MGRDCIVVTTKEEGVGMLGFSVARPFPLEKNKISVEAGTFSKHNQKQFYLPGPK